MLDLFREPVPTGCQYHATIRVTAFSKPATQLPVFFILLFIPSRLSEGQNLSGTSWKDGPTQNSEARLALLKSILGKNHSLIVPVWAVFWTTASSWSNFCSFYASCWSGSRTLKSRNRTCTSSWRWVVSHRITPAALLTLGSVQARNHTCISSWRWESILCRHQGSCNWTLVNWILWQFI